MDAIIRHVRVRSFVIFTKRVNEAEIKQNDIHVTGDSREQISWPRVLRL